MECRLSAWKAAVEQIDSALEPIARRPIAFEEVPTLRERYRQFDPLVEAGVRDAAEALIIEILDAYARANAADRAAMRALFAEHRAVGWAAGYLLPFSSETSTLRQQLLLFSLLDQGTDSRDALLWLRAFCHQPGVDCRVLPDLLREVAALSSAIDLYHMGSTASMLAGAASEF